jgi:hypothetical protein
MTENPRWDGTLTGPQFTKAMDNLAERTNAVRTEARRLQAEAPTRPQAEAGIVFSAAERRLINRDAVRTVKPSRRAR